LTGNGTHGHDAAMPRVYANGIDIEYELDGDPAGRPMLLVNGLGGQLVGWSPELLEALTSRGFHVIRFDNRDIGLSTWLDETGTPDPAVAELPDPPYTIADMADDAAGLLDALGVASAHIVGASMGGMIAQALAIARPEKTLTLTSIMSTTGNPRVGRPHEGVAQQLFLTTPPANDEEAAEAGVRAAKLIGSPGFEFDEVRTRANAIAAYKRAFHPAGVLRQALAVLKQADRTEALGRVKCPVLVIHGEADPLVDISGGRATAQAVPGAELWTVPGMGHHLPPELFAEVADRIAGLAAKAG
jgi:pimeloyl-ACP methyl ester carboxylesterase